MNNRLKKLLYGGLAILALSGPALAQQGLWPGFPLAAGAANTNCISFVNGTCQSYLQAGPAVTGNELAPVDTALPQGISPQTERMRVSQFGAYTTPRNVLGNGDMLGTQVNGTATVTGATTSAATYAALSADRWVLDTNVGSGVGRSAIVTATPSPPTGFTQSLKVYRTSGALTQPVCVWQAVPTAQSTQLAGQTVSFSAYVAALAGLSADNGNVANLVIITGTGTDQGWTGSWTASPAITPAWTGIATAVNTPISLTTTFARFSTSVAIPTTATEIGVGVCFTPTASGSGTTDGFALTGAQLERSMLPSLFEVRSKTSEVLDNQAFVYAIADVAGPSPVIALCTETTVNADAACLVPFPVTMYKAPTVSLVNCGTACFAMPTTTAQTAVTSTCVLTVNATFTLVAGTSNTYLQCAQSGTTAAVGITLPLMMSTSATNSGVIVAWTGL